MNCKVKQGCLTSESCCILLWLAFTLFPVSVVTAADNRKIDESQQKEVKAEMKGYVATSVITPFCVPLSNTVAPITGSPFSSPTYPFISAFTSFCWLSSIFPSQPSGGRESCFPIVYINDS